MCTRNHAQRPTQTKGVETQPKWQSTNMHLRTMVAPIRPRLSCSGNTRLQDVSLPTVCGSYVSYQGADTCSVGAGDTGRRAFGSRQRDHYRSRRIQESGLGVGFSHQFKWTGGRWLPPVPGKLPLVHTAAWTRCATAGSGCRVAAARVNATSALPATPCFSIHLKHF